MATGGHVVEVRYKRPTVLLEKDVAIHKDAVFNAKNVRRNPVDRRSEPGATPRGP
jgi:hypothetical protein